MLSVLLGLRGSNDLRVGRKMAPFPLFFQWGRTKDLSAPLADGKIPGKFRNVVLDKDGEDLLERSLEK